MKRVWLAALLIVPVAFGYKCVCAQSASNPRSRIIRTPAEATKESPVKSYRTWKRVNTSPARIASQLASLCSIPTPAMVKEDAANPHFGPVKPNDPFRERWINVYVNPIGAPEMAVEQSPIFPIGSTIVKEKLPNAASMKPELLTIMRKREPGYDPGHGDWEYTVMDGAGARIQAQGRLQNCRSCHAKQRRSDFVFRNYLYPR